MTTDYNGVVVVIPTRNRASLAMNAIRSVLAQGRCDVRVLVSDNSTEQDDADALLRYCDQLSNTHLRYVRPQEPLPMPQHWEWAMHQALSHYAADHFLYLTDRMIFKTGELDRLLDLVKSHPNMILSYNHDRIEDLEVPCRLEQELWTGQLLEIKAAQLLSLSSRIKLYHCLPRMLNCVAPRSILEAIQTRFGSIFLSIAPDFCFAYRSLEVVDSFLYYDRASIVHYAMDRSNGASQSRGDMSRDHRDFVANLGQVQPNFAAPIPGLLTVANTVMHEYCLVKQQTESPRFPDIDRGLYLQTLAGEIGQLRNPQLRREMEAILGAHGLETQSNSQPTTLFTVLGGVLTSVLKALNVRAVCDRTLAISWPDTKLWGPFDTALVHVVNRCFGFFPMHTSIPLESLSKAIEHVNRFPQRRFRNTDHLKILIEGGGSIVEVVTT